ncbi:hypothetical protein [Shouchella patagoniensis]|uniref:hypothetical protein n=1 Tax=Shouchella patagoniensis TaxID=228576 RepID=UPI000994BC9E|nr:hypothetical protein [Shouchella patagoniensis]
MKERHCLFCVRESYVCRILTDGLQDGLTCSASHSKYCGQKAVGKPVGKNVKKMRGMHTFQRFEGKKAVGKPVDQNRSE